MQACRRFSVVVARQESICSEFLEVSAAMES